MKNSIILKWLGHLSSTRAAGMYMLLFAIAIGVATFIENDFGTSAAQELIFKSHWFELLLLLFGCSIVANLWRYRLYQQKKWASLSFHLAIIIILIGSAVTRYTGTEGMMHIREGETTNQYLSAENYLQFRVTEGSKTYAFEEPTHFSSLSSNKFNESYQIGNTILAISLVDFIPNPSEKLVESPQGLPTLKIVIGGAQGREEYFLKQGEQSQINGVPFNFSEELISGAFNIRQQGDSLVFMTDTEVGQRVMATQESSQIPAGTMHKLMLRSLYTVNGSNFVIGDYMPKAITQLQSASQKITAESLVGLKLQVQANGQSQFVQVNGRKGEAGQAQVLTFSNTQIEISYGAKPEKLPFSLKCNDFILEKYPGTENPSSYASEVTLVDPAKSSSENHRIFMNNILSYQGYRFFQSSFDQDELGTYLSVNHDFWGTWISYIGYLLLTIGLAMTFFDKKSRFSYLIGQLNRKQALLVLGFLFAGNHLANGQTQATVSEEHAKAFGKILVQDHNGRIKPMNTYAGELMRKLARTETLFDQSADQLVLAMMLNPASWEKAAIIKLPEQTEIKQALHTEASMLSYSDFFTQDGNYVLEEQVRAAQAVMPREQGTYEKALIKLDEKVNIVNMIFSGSIFRLFPPLNDPNNTWLSPADLMHEHQQDEYSARMRTLFLAYLKHLNEAAQNQDYTAADQNLSEIANVQRASVSEFMPSETQVSAELFLNKLNVFNRLRNYYALLCLLLTGVFLVTTVRNKATKFNYTKWAFYAMAFGFTFHTLGIALRWYVSERAPWSNGYESMIYIGWTTMFAGTLFSRKSLGGLAATATLAATVLLVASMSWLDPEITPLVPVLKSYWLTIHVSLEAGSYGFLMLGAVLGMLNLCLMLFINSNNRTHILRAIKELTIISEITLLGGLAMVSIGTYLGGVWANESWGRYWGWDAKETWALVTILVYSFILHMRFIPKLQGIFAYNFASLFGFATVIMTYLGVNYYLSGLHSYAAGDPVPIPPEVYITTTLLILLSFFAYRNFKKYPA
ncbi:MAG: cytochrome c biogenesis protein CcsA [Aquirufa sp.]